MPSERSLYNKIRLVLEVARRGGTASFGELGDRVRNEGLDSFQTRQYDGDIDDFIWDQSVRSIRRSVRMCSTLNLLDERGCLTRLGREALRGTRFDDVLGSEARRALKESGVRISDINRHIEDKLAAHPPELPTALELWKSLETELPSGTFARLLTLLAETGGAVYTQKKLYLHIRIR